VAIVQLFNIDTSYEGMRRSFSHMKGDRFFSPGIWPDLSDQAGVAGPAHPHHHREMLSAAGPLAE